MRILSLVIFILTSTLTFSARLQKDSPYHKRIGWLKSPKNTFCTATLVGINKILTAAHCVRGVNKKKAFTFYLGKHGKNYIAKTNAYISSWRFKSIYGITTIDWAILKLDSSLGATYGYYKLGNYKGKIKLIGYGNLKNKLTSKTGTRLIGNLGRTRKVRLRFTNIKIIPGDSGAPIFIQDKNGNEYIRAVASGWYTQPFGRRYGLYTEYKYFKTKI